MLTAMDPAGPRGPLGRGPLTLVVTESASQAVVMRKRGLLTVLAVATSAVVYVRYVRPWQLTWGATPAEVARHLPSDELVTHPTFNATRAITIRCTT